MNNYVAFFSGLAVMAGVTYLVRMLPLYAVLAVMTVPAIFSSTASLPSAIAGFAVALVLAFFERGLLTVAAASCAAVFIAELILKFIG